MGTDRDWERFGQTEPYFGVLSAPRFSHPGTTEREEFFRTGEQHVESLLRVMRHADPSFNPRRALDFGCGVGRLVLPLARACGRVVGTDVSSSMLAEARTNCGALANVEFVQSDDDLTAVTGTFDLVHSFVVFQHIPVERGLKIAQGLIDRLQTGGWGALHFVYAVEAPFWWRAIAWIRSRVPLAHMLANMLRGHPVRRPFMQMNRYPLDRLFEILRLSGCHRIEIRFSEHGHFAGAMILFQRAPLPSL